MHRRNDKEIIANNKNSIIKSNELSIAEMNKGLTTVQAQLLSFSIYTMQQNGVTTFNKHEFEKHFNIGRYNSVQAEKDSNAVMDLKLTSRYKDDKSFKLTNVFMDMRYENGRFTFRWHPDLIEHILELKEKFIVTDLSITTKFKSFYSWRLYEFLNAHFGYWFISFSKEELLEIFGVSDVKSYVTNTAKFRQGVLDVAVKEINEHSEFDVWYDTLKDGRIINGYRIHWSVGKREELASDEQIAYIKELYDNIMNNAGLFVASASTTEDIIDVQSKIRAVKKINEETNIDTTKSEADQYIKRLKAHFKTLNKMAERGS